MICSHRKLLTSIGLIGGLLVLKFSSCVEGEEKESNLPEPNKIVQPDPVQNTSKVKAREALKNLKIPAFKNDEEQSQEIEPSDDVGFGGPDPEENPVQPDVDISINARAFLALPIYDVEGILYSYDLEETKLMDFVNALKELKKAIESGDRSKIRQMADEVLRVVDILESPQGKVETGRYKKIFKKSRNGKKGLKFVINIFKAGRWYAEMLADE